MKTDASNRNLNSLLIAGLIAIPTLWFAFQILKLAAEKGLVK